RVGWPLEGRGLRLGLVRGGVSGGRLVFEALVRQAIGDHDGRELLLFLLRWFRGRSGGPGHHGGMLGGVLDRVAPVGGAPWQGNGGGVFELRRRFGPTGRGSRGGWGYLALVLPSPRGGFLWGPVKGRGLFRFLFRVLLGRLV